MKFMVKDKQDRSIYEYIYASVYRYMTLRCITCAASVITPDVGTGCLGYQIITFGGLRVEPASVSIGVEIDAHTCIVGETSLYTLVLCGEVRL